MEDPLENYHSTFPSLKKYIENRIWINSTTLSPQIDQFVNETDTSGIGDDLALQIFGPRRDALYVVVPITVIYASIFLTGIIGNVSTCIVISRNKSMHTATNYYLFSMAISDLLLLVSGLPPEIYLVWSKYPYIFGETFCILRGLAAETSTNATVLTITAFTVERYVAICHPFLSHTMSKLSRAIKLILIIWLVALSLAIPQALQFGIVGHPSGSLDLVMCTVKNPILEHSFELSTFVFFLFPMTLITVLYALIGIKLRKSNMMKRDSGNSRSYRKNKNSGRKDRNCRHHTGRSSRRVLKMLVAVVVAFFICWAPFHVQRLIAIYGTNSVDHLSSNSPWMEFLYLFFTYVSGVLYYVSTTINPILYNIMSNKFRVAFMETLARCCRIGNFKGRYERPSSRSTISRSQQRTNGLFVCRNGTVRMPQESTDCSGNSQSIRDESIQQSISGGGCSAGGSTFVSKNPSYESSQYVQTGKWSSSKRASSPEAGNNEINFSETCAIAKTIPDFNYRDRWSGSKADQRNNDDNTMQATGDSKIPESPSSFDGTMKAKAAILYRRINKTKSNKKWWNIFKWLKSHKTSSTDRKISYSSLGPVDNVIINVQVNPEEYSMTPCNISNTSLRDVDRRAMDEELSAYMEEIRKREFQNEIRPSGNG